MVEHDIQRLQLFKKIIIIFITIPFKEYIMINKVPILIVFLCLNFVNASFRKSNSFNLCAIIYKMFQISLAKNIHQRCIYFSHILP